MIDPAWFSQKALASAAENEAARIELHRAFFALLRKHGVITYRGLGPKWSDVWPDVFGKESDERNCVAEHPGREGEAAADAPNRPSSPMVSGQ